MTSRAFWAWFEHRSREGQVPQELRSNDGLRVLVKEVSSLSKLIYS